MYFFKPKSTEFYKERSILTGTLIVDWKKNQNSYNFKKLPNTVILTPHTNYIKGYKKFITKKAKGLTGENYIIQKNILLSSKFGIGAAAIISHIEELKALGVQKFIFIGFAGILSSNVKEGYFYCISKVFSATGTSFFYNKEEKIEYKSKLYHKIKSVLHIEEKIAISTDAPFRETASFINNYIDKNCDLIDMETAAVLAFSKYYNLDSCCILLASDSIKTSIWSPPKNMKTLVQKIDDILYKLINIAHD